MPKEINNLYSSSNKNKDKQNNRAEGHWRRRDKIILESLYSATKSRDLQPPTRASVYACPYLHILYFFCQGPYIRSRQYHDYKYNLHLQGLPVLLNKYKINADAIRIRTYNSNLYNSSLNVKWIINLQLRFWVITAGAQTLDELLELIWPKTRPIFARFPAISVLNWNCKRFKRT